MINGNPPPFVSLALSTGRGASRQTELRMLSHLRATRSGSGARWASGRVILLFAFAIQLNSCGNESTGPTLIPVPASLSVVSGENQSGTVGSELPAPVVVRVLDSAGAPIAGQIVNFRVTSGGGTVFGGAAITNADGKAQERWTVGTTAGGQTLEARAVDATSGAALLFATFHASAVAGAPATVAVASGAVQGGVAGSALRDSLLLSVADQYGNPVIGVAVTWNLPAAGGTLTAASSVTSATGQASAKWTLGPTVGHYTVTAQVATLPAAQFTASVLPANPAALLLDTAAASSAMVSTTLHPVVRLVDAYGNGVPFAGIAAATVGQGSVSPVNAMADGTGRARFDWRLGGTVGANELHVTYGPLSLVLNATGTAAPAATLTPVASVTDRRLNRVRRWTCRLPCSCATHWGSKPWRIGRLHCHAGWRHG